MILLVILVDGFFVSLLSRFGPSKRHFLGTTSHLMDLCASGLRALGKAGGRGTSTSYVRL